MINILLKIFSLIIFLTSTILTAQGFQGKAVYESKSTIEMDLSGSGIPADRIKMIKERMKSRLEKTYTLTFNKVASTYKEEEKLDQSTSGRGGMRFMMFGGGPLGNYYKNIQTKTLAKESEFSGKNFLIKDDLITYEWKMEEETKMIGEHLCFKATTVVERPVRNTSFSFGRRNNDKKKEEEPKKDVMELIIITAWYTLDIPVSNGPGDYWGLPGLILEVKDGNTHILCSKIVINPKEKSEIKEPKKGKVVTQKEYDKIIEEKTKEMRERMKNEREKSGGSGRHFRIGG